MNLQADARASAAIARVANDIPTLRSSQLGDDRFVQFITTQARRPERAGLVVKELEGEKRRGYRLDSVLDQVLRIAKSTVKRNAKAMHPFYR